MDARPEYYLFLADLKHSSRLEVEAAKALSARLEDWLDDWRQRHGNALILGPSLNYGDEISALLAIPDPLFDLAHEMRHIVRPYTDFRFVVAQGPFSVINDDITQVGGATFKKANDAIGKITKQNRFCQWLLQDPDMSDVIGALTETTNVLVRQMTDYQYNVYALLRTGEKQIDIAERLEKSAQSVSDAVKRGAIDEVIDAEEVIRRQLRKLAQPGEAS